MEHIPTRMPTVSTTIECIRQHLTKSNEAQPELQTKSPTEWESKRHLRYRRKRSVDYCCSVHKTMLFTRLNELIRLSDTRTI